MYDQNFYGGQGGGWGLTVKWWGVGVIKKSFQNILNRGWVKAKVVCKGEGVLKLSLPLGKGKSCL